MQSSPKTKTVWTVQIPPDSHVRLRDGTVVKNTSPHSRAYLKIEMDLQSQVTEKQDENKQPA